MKYIAAQLTGEMTMFKLIKNDKKPDAKAMPEPIPTSSPDWRNQDESMAEWLVRADYMGQQKVSPITVIICGLAAVVLAVIPALEILGKVTA